MRRPIGQTLILLAIAASVTNSGSRPRAVAAPPDEQQRESSAAEPTSAASLASAAAVKAIDISVEAAAVPTVHPQLVECCQDLERTILRLRELDGYTARWYRQVRINGSLRDSEEAFIKIRHQPFSVSMEWLDGSRQVWFVEGQHENKLVARKHRGFGALRQFWRIPPESALAMKDSRYPITQLGMLKLAERLKSILASQPHDRLLQSQVATVDNSGRSCRRHVVEFATPDHHTAYARSEFHIDEETSVLVGIINHGWADDGGSTELLEHYRYDDIQFDPGLTDDDFDPQKGG